MRKMATKEIREKYAMVWSPKTIRLHHFLTSTTQVVSEYISFDAFT